MRRRIVPLSLALSAVVSGTVGAQIVTFQPGTPFTTTGLTGFATTGNLMNGMTVSWSFLGGGGSGSAIWGSLGGGLSGISSGGLSLSIGSGTDTFGGVFSLSNTSGFALQSLTLAGASGRTIFDCAWDGSICVAGNANADQGTVGSANGWTLQTNGGTFGGTVSAVYSNLVGIGINPPVGDLFEQLVLSFGANGLASGLTYSFIADTDNSPFDQPPPTSSTPEPSTFVLAGIGLIGLGTLGRRRGRA